jgi:hypothetical protein
MAGQATQARSSTGNQIQPAGARPFEDKKRDSRKKTPTAPSPKPVSSAENKRLKVSLAGLL